MNTLMVQAPRVTGMMTENSRGEKEQNLGARYLSQLHRYKSIAVP